MKRLIVLLLSLSILCLPVEARRRWVPKIGSAVQFIGLNSVGATVDTWAGGVTGATIAWRVQASSSFTMANCYVYSGNTNIVLCKVRVYDSTTTPINGDTGTVVGSTGTITFNGSTGFQPSAAISGAIVSGNFYWITISFPIASATFQQASDSTQTVQYTTSGDYYTTPFTAPNTVGVWGSIASEAPLSCYITN